MAVRRGARRPFLPPSLAPLATFGLGVSSPRFVCSPASCFPPAVPAAGLPPLPALQVGAPPAVGGAAETPPAPSLSPSRVRVPIAEVFAGGQKCHPGVLPPSCPSAVRTCGGSRAAAGAKRSSLRPRGGGAPRWPRRPQIRGSGEEGCRAGNALCLPGEESRARMALSLYNCGTAKLKLWHLYKSSLQLIGLADELPHNPLARFCCLSASAPSPPTPLFPLFPPLPFL